MAVNLSPIGNTQFVYDDGSPADGSLLWTYIAGSTTPLTTFTSSDGLIAQTNPIVLNSLGFPTIGEVFLTEGLIYDFVWEDKPIFPATHGAVLKTFEGISGINDNATTTSQWISSGLTPTYISATSFSLPGDQTNEFHKGRMMQLLTTAGTVYGKIINSVFTTLTTVTLYMLNGDVLDSGLSTANLSFLRADDQALPNPIELLRSTVVGNATATPTWDSAYGEVQDVSGVVTYTAIPNAPRPGAYRIWYPAAGAIMTNGGNITVQGNANVTAAAGDKWIINAVTSTNFYIEVVKASGMSIVQASVVGLFSNLKASATGLSALVTITADELVVKSAANDYQTLRAVSLAPSLAASGANGLDTGVSAASTWYSVWVIYNSATNIVAGLFSLSATAPTMPSGYTHKARVGWVRSDGTANKYPLSFAQAGRRVQYQVAASGNITSPPLMASGVAGTVGTTLVSVSTVNFIPPTAAEIIGLLYATSAQTSAVSPNSVAPTPGNNGLNNSAPSGVTVQMQFNFLVSGAAIFWASNGANSSLNCSGWVDNI